MSSILDDYIRDMDVAVGMLSEEDLSSKESLQDYQFRIKQLYDLEKFGLNANFCVMIGVGLYGEVGMVA